MKLRKAVSAILVSAAMALTLGAATGCSGNAEELIRESLNDEFSQIQNMDPEVLSIVSQQLPDSTVSMLGLTSQEIAEAMFDGFNGAVNDVQVNGNNAIATVTITSKNLSGIDDEMESITQRVQDDPSQFIGMNTEEIYHWCGQQFLDYIVNAPVETKPELELEYVKNGSTWEPTQDSINMLQSYIFS